MSDDINVEQFSSRMFARTQRFNFFKMNIRPTDLPDFADPPVVETVLSVQFEPMAELRAAHFGIYWDTIRDRFPKTEERSELIPIVERFPRSSRSGVGMQLETFDAPPMPRVWFVNASGTELIQIQRDRFIKNWRKTGEGDTYPRYEFLRAGFARELDGFESFLAAQGLPAPRINQCEVTYVNHIISGRGWTEHGDASQVFTCWAPLTNGPLGQPEDVSFQVSFPISGENNAPVGRLHAQMQSAYLSAGERRVFVLNLTARGQSGSGMDFLELGRNAIVKSFKALTTTAMHKHWGLKE